MPFWSDLFKIFTYAFEDDPLSKKNSVQNALGAGVTEPSAIQDIRQDGSFWGGGNRGLLRLKDSNDFIDLSSTTNRMSRYKEYERLRAIADIETVMTIIADEACIAGDTPIATPAYGYRTIKWLTENKKNDRFLVYCYDFDKEDYTLGWAYNPRLVRQEETIRIALNDGSKIIGTKDHRVLLKDGEWKAIGDLTYADELMAFYRLPAKQDLTEIKHGQFPRILTTAGWKHERQFVDEWRLGVKNPKLTAITKLSNVLRGGVENRYKAAQIAGYNSGTLLHWMRQEGYSTKELHWLARKPDSRKIIGIHPHKVIDVYDLSVEKYQNFCTDSIVVHNCQEGENDHVLDIVVKNQKVKKELEFLFFHRKMLNMDRRLWGTVKKLCIFGDFFWEVLINKENPKQGILGLEELPCESMYRLQTVKNKLVEFQQSKEGPDYQSLSRAPVTQATEADLLQSTATRFAPNQVVHLRIGEDRNLYKPYGQSLIEPARGPAHQLRLMEDSMLVYRLTRAPERLVFYVDTGQMPPFRVEAFMERFKDMFRKKKVNSSFSGQGGASAVDERWSPVAADENYFVPMKAGSTTRIDPLPGACLALDTEITVWSKDANDGLDRNLKLAEIIKEFEKNTLWTYSCHPITGEIVPGKITWAGITRKNAIVVKLIFSNEESVICTPDHEFPVFNKGFKKAIDLNYEDILIAVDGGIIQIKSIELLSETMDTGTLTIDGMEELHNFHTFALASGVFTKNSNLGEIDDALYFRNKLYIALNFPKNYLAAEDPASTRITLSALDAKFARSVERIQRCVEDGLYEIAERHLTLMGYPEETYEDLMIRMTPPSAWKELSDAEVITNRINNANQLKSSMLYADYDILTRCLKISEEDALDMISRNKLQKIEDARLQVAITNPQLLGIGNPGEGETEIGAQTGGPNPMLAPDGQTQDPMATGMNPEQPQEETPNKTPPLSNPTKDELKKYDLEIQTYSAEQDKEEVDYSDL